MKSSWRSICLALMESHETFEEMRDHLPSIGLAETKKAMRDYHSKLRERIQQEQLEENTADLDLMNHLREWASVIRKSE